MFCPECGKPLPEARTAVCPSCKKPVVLPPGALSEAPKRRVSKLCTAALLFGVGTSVFGMLTFLSRTRNTDLNVLGAVAAGTFFLAPLACIFGLAGVIVRLVRHDLKGAPRAIAGLILGLAFGALAAYCLLRRILFY